MFLKRLYDHSSGRPKVSGVKVLHLPREQQFSPRLVERAIGERWLSIGDGLITIHAQDGDHVYRIVRTPGYYCCHCEKSLENSRDGQEHVHSEHRDVPSPDVNNLSGWRKDNFYAGVNEGISVVEDERQPTLLDRIKEFFSG